ncbi:MAG: glycosyltransferase family 39 protein [Actinobacteria bacterium]|nr:glycosyltransferase family 39 protein [Actinomycetota bacterium]
MQKTKIKPESRPYIYLGYFIAIIILLVPLIISILKSVYYYQFDNDELYHSQVIYLLNMGFKPYQSFAMIFSDIFHIFLLPFFRLVGFTFEGMAKIRLVMAVLFAVRVGILAILFKRIFNLRTSVLFIFFYLFDPFTIFASMQIRPDNLMMIFYTLGLLVFVVGLQKKSYWLLFLSGIFLGTSALVLIKIIPSLAVLMIIFFIYSVKKNELKKIYIITIGALTPFILYFLYFFINGSFFVMFNQLFIVPLGYIDVIKNPVYYGFFHQANNGFIYGLMGAPLNWAYVWILPLMAAVGIYVTFIELFNKNTSKNEGIINLVRIILIISAILQYILILTLKTAFIQYYIPLQYLTAIFASVFVDDLISNEILPKSLRVWFSISTLVFIIAVTYVSVGANEARSIFKWQYQMPWYQDVWAKIPQSAAVFPNILFRPIGYPMTLGYDQLNANKEQFQGFKSSFPSHIESLTKNKVPYLIIDDPDNFYQLETGLKEYVATYYQSIDKKYNIYQRISQ